jgi:hypothetical protein
LLSLERVKNDSECAWDSGENAAEGEPDKEAPLFEMLEPVLLLESKVAD